MVDHIPIVLGISMFTILAVILGVAAVVVYFKGAKPEKPWGAPLLALLVIGAVASVICREMEVGKPDPARLRFQSARLVGQGLRDKISDGARVLIFRYPLPEEMEMPGGPSTPPPREAPRGPEGMGNVPGEMRPPTIEEQVEEKKKQWEKAIEEGAGGIDIEIVGCEVPDMPPEEMMPPEYPGDALAFSNVLEKYRDKDIDVWISFVGLPRKRNGDWALSDVVGPDWSEPPLVAADLGLYYEPDVVRQWIQDGLLDVAAIHPTTKSPVMEVITDDNLDSLPAKRPIDKLPPPPTRSE